MSLLSDSSQFHAFSTRHIGPNDHDKNAMLKTLGFESSAQFIQSVVPDSIRATAAMNLPAAQSETQALATLKATAQKNQVFSSFIGQGYYGTHTPTVILRNILENPAWYTAYTPYQPEISQGRLEALLNFQTMITELTELDIASASLLDEATAAAEAMALCKRVGKNKGNTFFIDENCFAQTIAVVETRAEPMGIDVKVGNPDTDIDGNCFGVLLQNPGSNGEVRDFSDIIEKAHSNKTLVAMAVDMLSLVVVKTPGAMNADIAVGSSQRFGVPMGFGGPHAGFMATRENFKRSLPGRLVGVSVDSNGNTALRLALQTREQHIRREKATSNICTAQVLLAVIASMYAVYHGPSGLSTIAKSVHAKAVTVANLLKTLGFEAINSEFFDTITIKTPGQAQEIHKAAHSSQLNFHVVDNDHVGISVDETTEIDNLIKLLNCFAQTNASTITSAELNDALNSADWSITEANRRQTPPLTHAVFDRYHSETDMMRYLRKLADKDIALDRSMIPLGSCTMKLNATSEMIPITWPEFSDIHPHAPVDQTLGYQQMITELEQWLCEITGYDAVSLQPNAGSQGEYAGLLAIRAYHRSRGEEKRNICLIPSSAHGTNPASAQMCGMKVVVVACDNDGNINVDDLREKAEKHSEDLAAIMITYPSTHGVFELSLIHI